MNKTSNLDRSIVIPSDFDFSMFPVEATGLIDIKIVVEGTIRATQNFKQWPIEGNNHIPWIHLIVLILPFQEREQLMDRATCGG